LGEQISFSDIFLSKYELRIPWRINTGATYFFGKKGFISADIEFVDHSKSHLSSNDFSTSGDNNTINSIYKSVVNFRLGGEFRHEIFRFRGGYSSTADPYEQENGVDNLIENIHYGLGLRLPKFFLDFGFEHSFYDSEISPYTLADGTRPVAEIENKRFSAVITGGFKF